MSFHRHSCPSIMIICIQPRAVAGADAGMALYLFFLFFEQLGWCPPPSRNAPKQTDPSAAFIEQNPKTENTNQGKTEHQKTHNRK